MAADSVNELTGEKRCGARGVGLTRACEMGRKRKSRRWGMPKERREPLVVKIAMLLLLLNLFVWTGFRGMDVLVVSLGSALLALAGWVTAHYGR